MGSQSVLTFREVDALALANEEGVLDQCGEAPSWGEPSIAVTRGNLLGQIWRCWVPDTRNTL